MDNHFVVDPAKFDFYAMDCYRLVGEDKLARTLADEVLRVGTDFDGTERSPMRNAEARVTLGVTAAREGDLEQALIHGERALQGDRQSVLSLIMTSRELAAVMRDRYSQESAALAYLNHLQELGRAKSAGWPLGFGPSAPSAPGPSPGPQRVRARVENGKHADGPVGSETLGSHHGASLEDHGPNVVL
ncbi:hypothetical protein AB0F96_22025 [Streptomyces sp. NPDC023998]|uniref:hypothetical protein n=1 Tax=Streptomyces sp. NPDC023998 TaxID=3154597 RepID=UPI0033C2424B